MDKQLFYVCAMTPEDCRGGIFGFILDEKRVPHAQFHLPFCGCNYLAYSVDRRYLYSTCIIDGAGGAAAFRIQADGSLELLNKLSTLGRSCCHLTAAPGGKYLYCANYFTSNLSEFALAADGSLEKLSRNIIFTGHGVHERQEVPHPHFVQFTPDNRQLILVDLGLDAIKLFEFDPESGLINPDRPVICRIEPGGSGPRHLVFNSSGNTAYLVNEIGNSVCVLDFCGGRFKCRQILSTLPDDCSVYSKAAAVRLSPDERFLLVSNRGFDSIVTYKVQDDGSLQLQDFISSGGVSPRDINFLPDGKTLAAGNEFSDGLVFFDYDPEYGKLQYNGHTVTLPRPLAIYW